MSSEYKILIDIVNSNLNKSGYESLNFELEKNLDENILNFPAAKLLDIEDDRDFLCELFYKALDRPIDRYDLIYYERQLRCESLNRIDIIKKVINSQEYKNKNTKLNLDNVIE